MTVNSQRSYYFSFEKRQTLAFERLMPANVDKEFLRPSPTQFIQRIPICPAQTDDTSTSPRRILSSFPGSDSPLPSSPPARLSASYNGQRLTCGANSAGKTEQRRNKRPTH